MIRTLLILTLVACPLSRATADEFTIHPYLTGDRNDLAFYPPGESNSQWHAVDDPGSHDGDATYIWGNETAMYQGLKSKDADIPAVLNGTIDTLRVLIVGRNHTGTVPLAAFVDTIGAFTESVAPTADFGSTYDSNWHAWTACPWTGSPWTRQDLLDLEFGVRAGFPGLGDTALVTQCHVAVIWTPSVPSASSRRRRLSRAGRYYRRQTVSTTLVTERKGHEIH